MAKSILQFTLLFMVLVLAQVLVFNRLYLFNIAIPLAFIYFIMRLPVTMSLMWVLTLSFFTGLSVDIFSDTLGMNALACTLLAPQATDTQVILSKRGRFNHPRTMHEIARSRCLHEICNQHLTNILYPVLHHRVVHVL